MTNGRPKFLYFDLGNVLLKFDRRTACAQLGALVGREADEMDGLVFQSQLQTRYELGELDSRQFYEQVCQRLSQDRSKWPTYEAFHWANSDIFQVHVPVMAIVGHLKAAGYPLGILSNTCEAHWSHITHRFVAISRYFRLAVRSDEQRCGKPDRAIYEAAARLAGVEPRDVFFVDDRPENVEGAQLAGLDAVLFDSPQQLAADLRARGVRFNY